MWGPRSCSVLPGVKQQCQDMHCPWRPRYKKGLSLRTVASPAFMNVKIRSGQTSSMAFQYFSGLLYSSVTCGFVEM